MRKLYSIERSYEEAYRAKTTAEIFRGGRLEREIQDASYI